MNRISRKWLTGLASLTLAATLALAGCGGSNTTTATPTPAASAPAASAPATSTPATTTPATPAASAPASSAPAASTPAATAPATGTTAASAPAATATNAPAKSTAAPAPATVAVQAPAPPSQWPLRITDDAGRTVTIPAEPQRIISLAPSNTETLFALGLGDRVVGVDNYSDYPAAATSIQKVGGLTDANVELMISLQPDLIVAIDGSQKVWQKLADQGVPVLVLQPKTIEGVLDSIRMLGKATNRADAAGSITARMQARIDEIRAQVARVKGSVQPTVFHEVWNDPVYTAGPGSFIDDMIRIAGGSNIFHDASSAWPVVTLESVVARDPQIILTSDASWASDLQAGKFAGWNGIAGVKSGSIYVLDPNLINRPGPRIVEGLWQVAKAVNPVLFGR